MPPTDPPDDPALPDPAVPLGQRLFDKPFLLLVLGIVVMFVFYTGWGLLDLAMLPPGELP